MLKTKTEKRKAKRGKKLKARRQKRDRVAKKDKAAFLFSEATWYRDTGKLDKALDYLERAVRLDPKNEEFLSELGSLGYDMKRPDVELKALVGLYNNGVLRAEMMPALCRLLRMAKKYEQALELIEETLLLIPQMKARNKRSLKASLGEERKYCQFQLEAIENVTAKDHKKRTTGSFHKPSLDEKGEEEKAAIFDKPLDKRSLPEIRVSVEVDSKAFKMAFSERHFTSPERYELALQGQRIRFRETFENLISLHSLRDVQSLWYQEETARKILKSFRGRALLADEVGLGKTIEALMVLKEYMERGMVRTALILTPTPLVSQWKGELAGKFGLHFPSTNDPEYRIMESSFWKNPFILASINIAKSKRNFPIVTEREYDLVIVDEAHHLKNRNTLNWKLINALKKRFLLFLTATPVENNLMELYNLVTLLKPGQLKTASSFRNEFMTRGDPTDPRNRSRLKKLLGQVMIRNTRALARIDIPPRFAQTIKVEPRQLELDLYERISAFARDITATNGRGHRLLLKNLLEEAGSSSRAVNLTLTRIQEKGNMLTQHEKDIRAINNICRCLDESSKNLVLLDIIKGFPDKKIIFVKYLGTLKHVSEFLTCRDIPHALFHGGLDNRAKDDQIESFRERKDILVTTEIGGEGYNLQFCHQMINYDLPWNPMKIEQRIGRLHRIGQEKEVTIYNLCAAGSIEDYILYLLDKKINMFEMVIGEIDMILGRIQGEQEFSDTVLDIWLNSESKEDREKAFSKLGSRLQRAKTGYQKTKKLDEKLFGEDYEL